MQILNDTKRLVMYVFDFPNPKVDFNTVAFIQYSELADIF